MTCTRRPRTSSSTSPEASFHDRVGGPVGPQRGRGVVVIGGWVLGLAAVVGLAILGGGSPTPDGPATALAVATPTPLIVPDAPPSSRRALRLDLPARRGEVVTTRELVVRGRVARDAGEVRIMLESSGGKPVATVAVDPTGFGHGGWVPFESRFRLSMPRPGGDMLLFVVAVDRDGIPIDAVRRRFSVGAIVEVPVPGAQPAS